MKLSDYIVDELSKRKIQTVFGHLGGFNADLVDSLHKNGAVHYVMGFHEQASAFAANSFSVLSENVGVATASGAPSACNLIPGIANAFFDSNACLFIAGSVHSKAVRESTAIRQNAFEEIDFVSLVSPISKYAVKISDPKDIRYHLEKAFYIAQEGRKGPVVLDIPYDVARSDIDPESLLGFTAPACVIASPDVRPVAEALRTAKKPLILLGGGATSTASCRALGSLLDKVRIPAVASLCGLDALPHDHPCFAGFIGHYGNRYANFALANCDLLLILGSRLDERQIAGKKTAFAPDATIIRVDIDTVELQRGPHATHKFHSRVEDFLEHLFTQDFKECTYSQWLHIIDYWRQRYPSYEVGSARMHPNNVCHALSEVLPKNAVVCADVGQSQMSLAQALSLDGERRLLNSAGYGSMGFSLPAAIGAAYAMPNTPIISVSGDGGLQMNIQELQTLRRDNLPVTVVIINNHCLGMIRRLQERLFDNRTSGSISGYSTPNFAGIAHGYDLPYVRIETLADISQLSDLLNDLSPKIVEILVETVTENIPEQGSQIDMQTPLLSSDENTKVKDECRIL